MVETVVQLKPRSEWRSRFDQRWYHGWTPGFLRPALAWVWPEFRPLTSDELVEEMNEKLTYTGWTNAFTQPIRNRVDMLTTGIRTPVGIKVYGRDLAEIERAGVAIERIVRGVPGTRSVLFERQQGGLYLDVIPRREALARYGLRADDLNMVVESAIGGQPVTTTIEGRARYSVNVRYAADFRSSPEAIREALVPIRGMAGSSGDDGSMANHVRIAEVADVRVVAGPPMIKDESGMLVGYVFVDVASGRDIGTYVQDARTVVDAALARGDLRLPEGGRLRWTGQYELLSQME
jgi:Cu(I)/Ag(I) efflux system membrane protein CusA/SilA